MAELKWIKISEQEPPLDTEVLLFWTHPAMYGHIEPGYLTKRGNGRKVWKYTFCGALQPSYWLAASQTEYPPLPPIEELPVEMAEEKTIGGMLEEGKALACNNYKEFGRGGCDHCARFIGLLEKMEERMKTEFPAGSIELTEGPVDKGGLKSAPTSPRPDVKPAGQKGNRIFPPEPWPRCEDIEIVRNQWHIDLNNYKALQEKVKSFCERFVRAAEATEENEKVKITELLEEAREMLKGLK